MTFLKSTDFYTDQNFFREEINSQQRILRDME